MTDVSALPIAGEAGADLTAEELGLFGYALAELQVDLLAMDAAGGPDAWFAQLDTLKGTAGSSGGPVVQALTVSVLDVLGEAVRDGELGIHDAAQALSWVAQTHGVKAISPAFVAHGGLVSAFALYDATHGHKAASLKRPPKTAKAKPAKAVAPHRATTPPAGSSLLSPLGGAGPVVTTGLTAGDKLVEAAEARIIPRRLEVPGMPEETARAIQWATSVAYYDATEVVAEVVTDVLARVDTVERLATRAPAPPVTVRAAGPHPAWALESALGNLTKRVVHLQDVIVNQGKELDRLRARQPATTTKPPKAPASVSPVRVSDLASQLGTVRRVQENHGAAISSIFRKLVPLVPLGTVAPALSQLSPGFVRNLPPVETSLEECCAENLAQTRPIKAYGGAHKLISDLKGALVKLTALGIVLGLVDTVVTILDAPLVLLSTMKTAEAIAPWAIQAANVALADLTWTDKLGQTS